MELPKPMNQRTISSKRAFLAIKVVSFLARPPDYLVVGTGRSGSGSIASSLSAANLACGHESVFTPWGQCNRIGLKGDSSWMAVPFLETFPGRIFHVVRDPRLTAQSFLDIQFFDSRTDSAFTRFARRHVPLQNNPIDEAFRWYLEWNRRAEAFAHSRFRLDQMPQLIHAVNAYMKIQHPNKTLPDLPDIPRTDHINQKVGQKVRTSTASIDMIENRKLREDVEAMAARYGFDLQQPPA